jgi:hypothetical protein
MARPVVKTADPGTKQQYRPLSADEKARIAEAIQEEYTLSAATRAALGDMTRYSAVVAAAKNDIEFGMSLEHGREIHRDNIRATIAKLALGYKRPLSFQGKLSGPDQFVVEHDIAALTLLSRLRLGEHLDKKSEQTVSGSISIDDGAASSRWMISPEDVACLNDSEKRLLACLVRKVQLARNDASAAQREFAAITDRSGAVDVEFADVDSEFDTDRLAAEVF